MSLQNIANVALEAWRASGARTVERRDASVTFYLESYFGPSGRWTADQRESFSEAYRHAERNTRAWEVR